MAWVEESLVILRELIDDTDDTQYRFTDARLTRLLGIAGKYVQHDAENSFNYQYTIAVSPDVSITPDPTGDTNFVDLMILRAACLIDHTEARRAAKNSGFSVREFSSTIDTKGLADARIKLLEKGVCKSYEDALFNFQAGDYVAGSAILGPFRTYYTSEYGRR